MLTDLFSSRARVDILKLFLLEPERRFYQREISTLSGQRIMAVQREVAKLLEIGLLKEEEEGNRKYYTVDRSSPIVADLKAIFQKTVGIHKIVGDVLKPLKNEIEFAFLFGSYARGSESSKSDVDVFVIGDISGKKLAVALKKIKSSLGREINTVIFTIDELNSRIRKKDHFLTMVNNEPKQFIIGTEDEYNKVLKRWSAKKA